MRIGIWLAISPLLVAGCVSHDPRPAANAAGITAEVQYRPSIDSRAPYRRLKFDTVVLKNGEHVSPAPEGASYPLIEVFLTNHRNRTLECLRVYFNARELKDFPEKDVLWWQFYPCPVAKPGETILLQISLRKSPSNVQSIDVETKEGERVRAEFGPGTTPRTELAGIMFSRDFHHVYITYLASMLASNTSAASSRPVRLEINGKHLLRSSRILQVPDEEHPGMVAITLRRPLCFGQPVHVRMQLADGRVAQSLLRASTGIMLDAFGVDEKDVKLRKELGLDVHPSTRVIPNDPACDDSHAEVGYSTKNILPVRRAWFESIEVCLSAAHLCVLATPQVEYPIYGQSVDALQVNPYRLSRSRYGDDSKFIEQEENFFFWAWHSARPRPWHWIPEAYAKDESTRMLDAQELRLLTYAALGHGAKGINYYSYDTNSAWVGFNESPELLGAVKRINSELKQLEPILSSTIPLSIKTTGSHEDGVRTHVLWSGERQGLLLIFRNLDYSTEPDHLGRTLIFGSRLKRDVRARVSIPAWFKVGSVMNPLDPTNPTIPFEAEDRAILSVNFKELRDVAVAWCTQRTHSTMQKHPRRGERSEFTTRRQAKQN